VTVATTGGNGGVVGLEDIRPSDLRIPRLKINHPEGMFIDPLTQMEYPKLTIIVLGAVRGRVKWHKIVEQGDTPQCKSPDDEHGFPTVDEELAKRLRFPWEDSNFDPNDFPPDESGRIVLPCRKCIFTRWGDNKVPPPCTESLTLPLLYSVDGPDSDEWNPALWTVQKTSIKPAQNYIGPFAQRKVPTFVAMAEVTLNVQTRGTNKYSVPKIRQLGPTDRDDHEGFANQYLMTRNYLRQFPGGGAIEEELPQTSDNTNTPAPTAPAATASAPVTPPATATPPPTPEPVPVPAPAAAPVAPPVQTTQTTPAPVSPAAPAGDDDDDLPF
jgi:hypothetical protein